MIRAVFVLIVAIFATLTCANGVIIAGLLGVEDKEGGAFDVLQRSWARLIIWAAGVKVVLHGEEHIRTGKQIIVGNHVSLFDVLALCAAVPRCRFVAKHEIRRIPIVGPAAGAAGHVYIERENRKASFEQYKAAAARIHAGVRVIVFAEGTRGYDYPLRSFKKGPFVLAVSAGAPIVPMLIHGTIPMMRKGSFLVRSGTAHIHFMPPIESTGLSYDDRNALAAETHAAIAALLEREYGVASPRWDPRRPGPVAGASVAGDSVTAPPNNSL
ncbi:MAG: lysophospholipid acyltransferase family protein [Gemmatimonadetes bacterium]|nr:lysophospholipid acyltransferase family protein [Gemmatimonadota bacterium]